MIDLAVAVVAPAAVPPTVTGGEFSDPAHKKQRHTIRSRSASPVLAHLLPTICEEVVESVCWIQSATGAMAKARGAASAHSPTQLAESLGALLVPSVSGPEELVTTLWALGELATDGTFSANMMAPFEAALQAFILQHMGGARALHVAMVLGSMAKLTQSGFPLKNRLLASLASSSSCDRYCTLVLNEANSADAADKVRAGDVLSDVLWALAVLSRPLPAHSQLQLLGYRAADPAWLESASLHMVARALWGLTKLQSMGDNPLLEPYSAEWRGICTAFLDRAAEADSQDAGALEMFTEALALLSSEAGSCAAAGSPQCLSDKMARKYLKKACFTLG